MPVCGHPTKNGTPCKRESPYCWQHRANRWRTGGKGRLLAVMTVISFLWHFVETPRIKLGFSDEGATSSQRILAADSAPAKVDYPAANVLQPANVPVGIVGQLPVSPFVGFTEKNLTIDSVTATVDRQLPSNIFSSQQTSILTSISLTEPNKSFPILLGAQQIPTFTPSNSLTEPNKSLPGLFDVQQIPTFTSSTSLIEPNKSLSDFLEAQQQTLTATAISLPEVNKPLPGFLEAQQQTLASFSLTAAPQAAPGLLWVQQFPGLNSLTGSSPDGHVIPQTFNPVVLTMPGSCRDLGVIPSSAIQ
jgi:hypothetical protein